MLNDPANNDNDLAPRRGKPMRIFIFKSDGKPGLRAFCDDLAGTRLPSQFAPWHATGAVAPDRDPPHKLSRDVIETAIKAQGFQLWRVSNN
jgi:hypothetical protein